MLTVREIPPPYTYAWDCPECGQGSHETYKERKSTLTCPLCSCEIVKNKKEKWIRREYK